MNPKAATPLLVPLPSPEVFNRLCRRLQNQVGTVVLSSTRVDPVRGRYSFLAADPFLIFSSRGSHCEWRHGGGVRQEFGNPWRVLENQLQRYESLDELDLPFPAGGCFGFCGYGMRYFVEPKLPRKTVHNHTIPDAWFGFHSSLIALDHQEGAGWIVATGLDLDGNRTESLARRQVELWLSRIAEAGPTEAPKPQPVLSRRPLGPVDSNLSETDFITKVEQAKRWIRSGDIYQVNLSHQLRVHSPCNAWDLFQSLSQTSPAPYAAFLQLGDSQIVSSSPELFLRMRGDHILTRPIKGTRPRAADPELDSRLSEELIQSPKERAELVMITDLLRNDIGKISRFGSVKVPDLARLERFAQVQHLVSTVEGRLLPEQTHFSALASMFPGGSITGAPKFRAMEIIDALEPHDRGPYTGIAGYLGFNRESQMNILIRTAACHDQGVSFHVGAGIVADSVPEAEHAETWAKAKGFLDVIQNTQAEFSPPTQTPA